MHPTQYKKHLQVVERAIFGIQRVNPGLPPRASSKEAACARIVALVTAAMIFEKSEINHLALDLLHKGSHVGASPAYIIIRNAADKIIVDTGWARLGSDHKLARDSGGRVAQAYIAMCKDFFNGLDFVQTTQPPYGAPTAILLGCAFSSTWNAMDVVHKVLLNILYGSSCASSSYQEAIDAVSQAVESEWEFPDPMMDMGAETVVEEVLVD
jgi:hypothetical protein